MRKKNFNLKLIILKEIAQPLLSSFKFDKNRLSGVFTYEQEGKIDRARFCCRGLQAPKDYTNCTDITVQTGVQQAFSSQTLENLEYGYEYGCYVEAFGVSGNLPSTQRFEKTGKN